MSNMAQPNYSEALKEIKKAVQSLSEEVLEIKTLLFKLHGVKEKAEVEEKMYPWHFPNVTTTADYHEEEQ